MLRVAEERVRNFIATLPEGTRQFEDRMDDGTAICVRIQPTAENRLVIDFAGTGPTSSANFNANPSIVTAAVIYVLRCLIADDLPLNEGMLAAIDLKIPEGILNPRPATQLPIVRQWRRAMWKHRSASSIAYWVRSQPRLPRKAR